MYDSQEGEERITMGRKKKVEVVVEEEVQPQEEHVVVHHDRLDSGSNNLVAEALPSLDD